MLLYYYGHLCQNAVFSVCLKERFAHDIYMFRSMWFHIWKCMSEMLFTQIFILLMFYAWAQLNN